MYLLHAFVPCIVFLTLASAAPPNTFNPRSLDSSIALQSRGNYISLGKLGTPADSSKVPKYTKPRCSSYKYFYCQRRCKCMANGELKCNEKHAQEISYIVLPSQRLLGMDIDKMVGNPNPDVTGTCTPMCYCNVNGTWTFALNNKGEHGPAPSLSSLSTEQNEGVSVSNHDVYETPPDSHVIDVDPADPSDPHTLSKSSSKPSLKSHNSDVAGPSNPSGHHPELPHASTSRPEISVAGPSNPSGHHPELPHPSTSHPEMSVAGPSNPVSWYDSSGVGPSNPPTHPKLRRRGNSQSELVSSESGSLGEEISQGRPSITSQRHRLPTRRGRILCGGSDKLYCQAKCYCTAGGIVVCDRQTSFDKRPTQYEAAKLGKKPGEMLGQTISEITLRCSSTCRCEMQGFFGLGRASEELPRRISEERSV
jgi:hypothetical protein